MFMEQGAAKPPRASDIILGMTAILAIVVFVARALTELFTAA